MPTSRKCLYLALLVLVPGVIAGCSGSVSTGSSTNAEEVASTIQEQYPAEADKLELTTIDCESTEAEVDATFGCTAENDAGVNLEIEGTINEVDDDVDQVKFNWKIVKATSDGVAYAETAVATLQNQGYAVESMICPEIVIEKGNQTECEVTMKDGSSQVAQITLTDDDGGFDVVTSGPGGN